MADLFATQFSGLDSPYTNSAAVTTSDSTPLSQPTRAIYVGVAGDITMELLGDSAAVLFKACPVGVIRVRASLIKATGTTATNIVALW